MPELIDHLNAASRWLGETALVGAEDEPAIADIRKYPFNRYQGSLKDEYFRGDWRFFGTSWHTGQAVKAWVMAAPHLDHDALAYARTAGDWLLANQVREGDDRGLLYGYEDFVEYTNTSAQLEALDGLFHLAEAAGEERYREAAMANLDWVARKAWLPEQGLFRDLYDPAKGEFFVRKDRPWGIGRPLLDDAVFLTGYRLSGEDRFLDIAVRVADKLLEREHPEGNWLDYQPCVRERGSLHPRQGYWWGRPMLALYRETGEARYLYQFQRCLEWYRKALRVDGGIMRDTRLDFRTDSLNLATSASACAGLVFLDALEINGDAFARLWAERILRFCQSMQILEAEDPNLRGAVVEKIRAPGGSDRPPYFVRNIASSFFLQLGARWLALDGA